MRPYLLPSVTFAIWATALSGLTSAQQPTFPVEIEAVTVDVVVLDREGKPVEGLTRDDFTVREDGQSQAITTFEAVALHGSPGPPGRRQRVSTNTDGPDVAGRWFFVVFDDVNISQFSTLRARDAIGQFLERALGPGDQVMIAASSGGSSWTGTVPDNLEPLQAFVGRLQGARRPDTTAARIWDHEAMGIALGRDRQAFAQVARRYFENGLIPEAYPIDRDIRDALDVSPGLALIQVKARQTYAEATSRIGTSLAMLERLSLALAQARGRKTLLFVSEGFIMDPSLAEFRALVQTARRANVAVHFVDVRSPDGALGQPGMPGGTAEAVRSIEDRDASIAMAMASREADGARSVALDTGGSVVAGTRLADGLARIVAEGRSYYLLAYSPTNRQRDGRFRRIEVTVNRRDVDVRARSGYYAPAGRETPRTPPDKLDPALRAALDAPFDTPGIPMRLASYVFGAQADGTVQTMLLAEIDLAPLKIRPLRGTYSADIESYLLVHNVGRDVLQREERLVEIDLPPAIFEQTLGTGLPIRRELQLASGRYQATLLLRDRATGLMGSVRHEFDVPRPDQFRISTPVMTDIVQPDAAGGAARPIPIARRVFRAGSRLVSTFDIYGARPDGPTGAPRVSVGYRLLGADGAEIAGAPPQPVTPDERGGLAAAVGVTLAATATGEHELVLIVRDEVATRTIEDRERFVIER